MDYPKEPIELYTFSTIAKKSSRDWSRVLSSQQCPYLGKKCIKIRKSESDITIGTCTVGYQGKPIVICPHRFLQRRQIFLDAVHLLEGHKPGNQLHVVPEITMPGGSVDYFIASVSRGQVKDFLGLEIQTLDTTGTVWPSREAVILTLLGKDSATNEEPADTSKDKKKSYAMNWKMTAKTLLVQMHHKVETLERLNKKLVLVVQDVFYDYVTREFQSDALRSAETADSAHFHVYSLELNKDNTFVMEMRARYSTTTIGVESMLGRRSEAAMAIEDLSAKIKAKISPENLLTI